MTNIVVDRSTDNAKPHSICFFTIISTSKDMSFSEDKGHVFFRAWRKSWHKERARFVYNFLAIWLVHSPKWAFLNGSCIAWHIDASSVFKALIDNGKLANQIARLVAIVVKMEFALFCSNDMWDKIHISLMPKHYNSWLWLEHTWVTSSTVSIVSIWFSNFGNCCETRRHFHSRLKTLVRPMISRGTRANQSAIKLLRPE